MFLWGWEEERRRQHWASWGSRVSKNRVWNNRHGLRSQLWFLLFDLTELQFPHLQSGHGVTYLSEEMWETGLQTPALSASLGGASEMLIPSPLLYTWTDFVLLHQQSFSVVHSVHFLSSQGSFYPVSCARSWFNSFTSMNSSNPHPSQWGNIVIPISQMMTLRHRF